MRKSEKNRIVFGFLPPACGLPRAGRVQRSVEVGVIGPATRWKPTDDNGGKSGSIR